MEAPAAIDGDAPADLAADLAASLTLPGAAAAQDILVATFNTSTMNTNPLEFHCFGAPNDDMAEPGSLAALYKTVFDNGEAVLSPANATLLRAVFPGKHVTVLARLCKQVPAMAAQTDAAVALFFPVMFLPFATGLMGDARIADARLISWPDRHVNALPVTAGAVNTTLYRPTVVNGSDATFSCIDDWFGQWCAFMFGPLPDGTRPVDRLRPLRRARYAAVTPKEEAASLPLQLLYLAAFDAVMVHAAIVPVQRAAFFELKRALADKMVLHKNDRLAQILTEQYLPQAAAVGLQECSRAFVRKLRAALDCYWHLMVEPAAADSGSDQLSAILVSAKHFDDPVFVRVPEELTAAGVEPQDLCLVEATHRRTGRRVLLASYHAQTGGVRVPAVLRRVSDVAEHDPAALSVAIVIMADTNACVHAAKPAHLSLAGLQQLVGQLNMTAAWSPRGPEDTTFKARTIWQAQSHKAVRRDAVHMRADRESKDTVITNARVVRHARVDNTGRGPEAPYVHGPRPTAQFPSDHGIVSCILRL
jgi:hypothetical protein